MDKADLFSNTAAEFYADLASRAQSSSQEVLDFNSSWVNGKEIFDRAVASRAKKPEGIPRLSIHDTFMPDDEEEEEEEVKVDPKLEDTEMKDAGDQPEEEEEDEMKEDEIETPDAQIPTVIRDFKGRHPNIGVEASDGEESGKRTVRVRFSVSILRLLKLINSLPCEYSLNYQRQLNCSSPSTCTYLLILQHRRTSRIQRQALVASSLLPSSILKNLSNNQSLISIPPFCAVSLCDPTPEIFKCSW